MNAKQHTFLEAMLKESTVQKAAKVAGISRNTAYRYLNDPEFADELSKRRGKCLAEAVQYLRSKLSKCSEELVKIVDDPGIAPQIRINAINAAFSAYKNLGEAADIQEHLERVEKQIADLERQRGELG